MHRSRRRVGVRIRGLKFFGAPGLAAGLLITACGGSGGEGAASVAATRDTFRGAERLHYAATGAPALDWRVDSIGVVGSAFGDEKYQFGNVRSLGLAGDSAGNLYVVDVQAEHVGKYGPDGRYLATFGREGGGPGEFLLPYNITLGPGDSLWIGDLLNNRFTVLPQDGGGARTIRFPENTFLASRLVVESDRYVVAARVADFGPPGKPIKANPRIPLVAYTFDGLPLDTVWRASSPKVDRAQLESGGYTRGLNTDRAFSPQLLFAAFSDGTLAVSDTADYLVAFVSRDGTVREWIQRDPPPRATTGADREAERERKREAMRPGSKQTLRVGGRAAGEGDSDPLLERSLARMTFEDVIPRIVNLAIDPADRLWVGVSENTPGEVERIDVYDHDGRLLGELHGVPFPDVFLGRSRMGVLTRDELDVPHVVLYRITPGITAS